MDFDVVLVGTDINAYYMARNFHEAYSIKPHVVGTVPMALTNIVDFHVEKDLLNKKVFVDTLVDLAKKIDKKKIILIGCNDEYISLIIENSKVLSKYYLFNYYDF